MKKRQENGTENMTSGKIRSALLCDEGSCSKRRERLLFVLRRLSAGLILKERKLMRPWVVAKNLYVSGIHIKHSAFF
jgi:hypothetical protein